MSVLLLTMGPQLGITADLPVVGVGGAGVIRFRAIGASGPVKWTLVDSTLPAEWDSALNPDGNAVTLTTSDAETPGTFSVTVRAVDNARIPVVRSFDVRVMALPLTISGAFPEWSTGLPATGALTISGGVPPYSGLSVTSGALPSGVSLSIVGDQIVASGTPTVSGAWSAIVQVSDAGSTPASLGVMGVVKTNDPYWSSVVSLMHFDGDLKDETGRVWSQSGSPIIGGVGRFGGCITFSGSSSERVYSTHPAFGTDDWTVEMWVKFNSTTGQQNFFENLNSAGINPAGRFTIYQKDNDLIIYINTADRINTPTPSTSVWNHISVSCESGIVRLFVNGEVKGSWNSGGLNFDQTLTSFGVGFVTNSLFGAIDELRITKGVARYTEDFDPPTSPFPNY